MTKCNFIVQMYYISIDQLINGHMLLTCDQSLDDQEKAGRCVGGGYVLWTQAQTW